MLLEDSLGGNNITLLIACVSNADHNGETLCAIQTANSFKKIKNKMPKPLGKGGLGEVEQLKLENAALKAYIADLNRNVQPNTSRSTPDLYVTDETTNKLGPYAATLSVLKPKRYTIDEQSKIIKYIIKNESFYSLRGNLVWQQAGSTDRSWQSLKEHFRRVLYDKLDKFASEDILKINLEKIKLGYLSTKTK